MIKLSDLIRFRTILNSTPIEQLRSDNKRLQMQIIDDLTHLNIDYRNYATRIGEIFEDINTKLKQVETMIEVFKDDHEKEIRTKDQEYHRLSRKIYLEQDQDTSEYILDRTSKNAFVIQDEYFEFFSNRLTHYVDWRFAGLQFRPASGVITEHLKGLDPLYLVDTHPDLFSEVKKLWDPAYQRRLRYYTVQSNAPEPLVNLPKNQFSCIVAYDFFNYMPLHIVEKYFRDCYNLLTFGGGLTFTYNNCDEQAGTLNVENGFACWQPKRKIIELLENIGFQVVFAGDYLGSLNWLEVVKLGQLKSIRGCQTLAEIRSLG